MHCCTKLLSFLLRGVMLACLLTAMAHAEGIAVNKAEMRSSDDGYQLTADFDINLSFVVQQALSRGVPIYFVGEFSLTRSRWYWLDEQIFQSEQSTKLSYNVLTRQYRISRGALFQNFASLEEVLRVLSRQSSTPIPAQLMKKEGNYIASARLRLDTKELPRLLQVNVLTSKDWELNSDWYRWLIRPTEIAVNGASKPE